MRVVIALCLLMLAPPLAAQELGPSSVIAKQFEAFRQGDLERAFSYASPNLQRYFGNSSNFGSVVSQGYGMVLNPDQTRMLDLRKEGARLIQRVEVIDRKGVVYLMDYELIETEDGWKINGVEFAKSPPVAV